MSTPSTAREAMARIVLDEVDALTKRLEVAAQRLDAASPTLAADLAEKIAEKIAARATAATQAEMQVRAKEHWAVVGAVASRAAADAAVAAIQKMGSPSPRPALPPWITWLLGTLLLISLTQTILLFVLR